MSNIIANESHVMWAKAVGAGSEILLIQIAAFVSLIVDVFALSCMLKGWEGLFLDYCKLKFSIIIDNTH